MEAVSCKFDKTSNAIVWYLFMNLILSARHMIEWVIGVDLRNNSENLRLCDSMANRNDAGKWLAY